MATLHEELNAFLHTSQAYLSKIYQREKWKTFMIITLFPLVFMLFQLTKENLILEYAIKFHVHLSRLLVQSYNFKRCHSWFANLKGDSEHNRTVTLLHFLTSCKYSFILLWFKNGAQKMLQNALDMIHTFQFRDMQILQKSRSHLKILGTKRVTWSSILRTLKYKVSPHIKFNCLGDLASGICTPCSI